MTDVVKNSKAESTFFSFIKRHIRKIIYAFAVAVHLIVLLTVNFTMGINKEEKQDLTIFKMVDVREYDPKLDEKKASDTVEINRQDKVAEDVLETDKEVKELDIDYLPQHKVSDLPVLPENEIRSKIIYPPLANKQGITNVQVILDLYIDKAGYVKKIKVIKDPGYGFAESALKAYTGIKGSPARANGIPVNSIYRKSIRFRLQ